mmetsp:Transcript_13555/g.27075  ORF Transcript_13555/g.27075 Transcript_13555/m.27075 type:complete len:276 (+) Transcript_13555:634-1461(+)
MRAQNSSKSMTPLPFKSAVPTIAAASSSDSSTPNRFSTSRTLAASTNPDPSTSSASNVARSSSDRSDPRGRSSWDGGLSSGGKLWSEFEGEPSSKIDGRGWCGTLIIMQNSSKVMSPVWNRSNRSIISDSSSSPVLSPKACIASDRFLSEIRPDLSLSRRSKLSRSSASLSGCSFKCASRVSASPRITWWRARKSTVERMRWSAVRECTAPISFRARRSCSWVCIMGMCRSGSCPERNILIQSCASTFPIEILVSGLTSSIFEQRLQASFEMSRQ